MDYGNTIYTFEKENEITFSNFSMEVNFISPLFDHIIYYSKTYHIHEDIQTCKLLMG